MRCYCCNTILTPQQAVRRFEQSLSFADMCDKCLNTIDVPTVDGEGFDENDYEKDSSEEDDFE
jgi:hypothetical protein